MQHDFIIANGDTDSIAFKKPDQSAFTPEERASLLSELNALMPENIIWKDDNHYRRLIVFKAKNYVMDDGKKIKIKGSALKGSKKEPALQAFTRDVIDLLLRDRKDQVLFLYLKAVYEIDRITDITPWCFKVTVTKKVLEGATTFQKKQLDAIGTTPVSEGDKVYLYFREDGSLSLRENFKGDHDKSVLLGKLRDTLDVFGNVFDVELFPDFTLKKSREMLAMLNFTMPAQPTKTTAQVTEAKALQSIAATQKINAVIEKMGLGIKPFTPPVGVKMTRF